MEWCIGLAKNSQRKQHKFSHVPQATHWSQGVFFSFFNWFKISLEIFPWSPTDQEFSFPWEVSMGSNATAKAPQVFSLDCQQVKPRDSEESFSVAFISYSSSLRELQGLPGVWGVTAPVPWEMFRNHIHTAIEYAEQGFRKYPSLWTQAQYINKIKYCVFVDTCIGFLVI